MMRRGEEGKKERRGRKRERKEKKREEGEKERGRRKRERREKKREEGRRVSLFLLHVLGGIMVSFPA